MASTDTELVQLWDRPGLSWDVRTMLAPALNGFEDDPGKSKSRNLEALLSRLSASDREHIESLSLKKPAAFYDKVVAAFSAERDLIASRTSVKVVPDVEFDDIAAGFEETKPSEVPAADDEMDIAGYSADFEISAFEDATRFVDELLAMKGGRN